MGSCSAASCLTVAEGYRLWASTYDREGNPLLSLETRILEPLLPCLTRCDVIDVGCGTGRWLELLRNAGARTLVGIDISKEMLEQAKAKLGKWATLLCGDYTHDPVGKASADVVLCNFVLSYVDEAEEFIGLVRNLLRPGGSFFLTDVHPETAAKLNWRRGVRVQERFEEIRTKSRSIGQIIAICRNAGLEVKVQLEPRFGGQEKIIFEQNGKGEYFNSVREYPAIFVLQLTAPATSRTRIRREKGEVTINRLHGARFALGPGENAEGEIFLTAGRIDGVLESSARRHAPGEGDTAFDLCGYLVLPGLINAHDHLEFALFPRLGKGSYQNFLEWAEDIHRVHAWEIARQRRVPKDVRLWWGGIRNLLSGVTTVCHHNPYDPAVFSNGFVVRVLGDYAWAHSLALDPAAAVRKKAAPQSQPFFIHLAEGIDEQSSWEIFAVHQAGALDEYTVIIHGLGMDEQGCALLRSTNAGLVWCPSSNLFLFDRAMSADQIARFPKAALGSDSPLTADGDLLDEVRCAYQTLGAPAEQIYRWVTRQPAGLLRLKHGEGTLRVGAAADLIAVRDIGLTPAETLVTLKQSGIELVLIGGRVQLVSAELKDRLPLSMRNNLQPLCVDGVVKWIRAPLYRLLQETRAHLGDDIYVGGKHVYAGD
jgi:cytosine/adenosine deaminase-related metal-dependent hydrolase/ubiquinone/menaquinone biosynthesis C-methylase UbiE